MLLPVSDNVDEMWSLFEETLTAAIEQFVPRSVTVRNNKNHIISCIYLRVKYSS